MVRASLVLKLGGVVVDSLVRLEIEVGLWVVSCSKILYDPVRNVLHLRMILLTWDGSKHS